jgi:hypothetical protein
MAAAEDNFFYPTNSSFCWTSNEDGEQADAPAFETSNVDRLLSQQHGVQFDPKNKVCKRKVLLFGLSSLRVIIEELN